MLSLNMNVLLSYKKEFLDCKIDFSTDVCVCIYTHKYHRPYSSILGSVCSKQILTFLILPSWIYLCITDCTTRKFSLFISFSEWTQQSKTLESFRLLSSSPRVSRGSGFTTCWPRRGVGGRHRGNLGYETPPSHRWSPSTSSRHRVFFLHRHKMAAAAAAPAPKMSVFPTAASCEMS